jgi:hypothetical protein
MRDPDNIDDVLKVDTRGDDVYDSFRYGLFGQLGTRKRPAEIAIQEHAKELDPLARHFYLMKMAHDKSNSNEPFVQKSVPIWQGKCGLA